jgi:phosphatidylserine/phosphatidylglycerophosphate/cardiolipin synthase-like enzyme
LTAGSPAASEDDVEVYFSPEGGAMGAIVNEIEQARRSVDVSAYLITAKQIVDALAAAQQRGVRVRIVLDRDHVGAGFSVAGYLGKSGLAVWRDGRHKEAHNKVMLIDGETIITGSFNFTDQAEHLNAENLLVIRDKPTLFEAYLADFEKHLGHSDPPAKDLDVATPK